MMKVWFGATSLYIEKYISTYRKIKRHLLEKGCVILFDWIEDAYSYKKEHPEGNRKIKYVYSQVLDAIDKSDISIIEYTVPNFSSSHQIIYSIHKHKPTLVMRKKKDNSFADSYLEALDSKYLSIKDYKDNNYKEIINEFLGESDIDQGLNRYNIVLDKKQKYYLDWISAVNKISRSETVRKALDELINKDEKFKKYLSQE